MLGLKLSMSQPWVQLRGRSSLKLGFRKRQRSVANCSVTEFGLFLRQAPEVYDVQRPSFRSLSDPAVRALVSGLWPEPPKREAMMAERGIEVDHATIHRWTVSLSRSIDASARSRTNGTWTKHTSKLVDSGDISIASSTAMATRLSSGSQRTAQSGSR